MLISHKGNACFTDLNISNVHYEKQIIMEICGEKSYKPGLYVSITEVDAKASIETQRRALEKHSLVLPPATPSYVTDTYE